MDSAGPESGHLAGDPSGEIPKVVPKMRLLFVPFPSRVFIEIVFDLNSLVNISPDQFLEHLKALVARKYVLTVATLPSGESKVGVLGKIRHLNKRDDGKVLIGFRGIERANYIDQGFDEEINLGLVRRLKFPEIPISSEPDKNSETLMQIEELRGTFKEFCERFSLTQVLGGSNYFRNAEVLIEEATPSNIKETTDAVALVLSYMGIGIDLFLPTYVILQEQNVGVRLRNLIDLLKILLKGLLNEDDLGQETDFRELLAGPADEPDKKAGPKPNVEQSNLTEKPRVDIRELLSTKEEKEMAEKGLGFLENAEGVRKEKLHREFETYYQNRKKKKK